jgi:hypothetical protein
MIPWFRLTTTMLAAATVLVRLRNGADQRMGRALAEASRLSSRDIRNGRAMSPPAITLQEAV